MPRGKHPKGGGRIVEIRCDPHESEESFMCALLIVKDDASIVLQKDRRLQIQDLFERQGFSFEEDTDDDLPESERRLSAIERFYEIMEERSDSFPSWLMKFEPVDINANVPYDGYVTVERIVKKKSKLKRLGVVVKMSTTGARKYNKHLAALGKQNEVITVIVHYDFSDDEILDRFLNGIRGKTGLR